MAKKGISPSNTALEEIEVQGVRLITFDKINYLNSLGFPVVGIITEFRKMEWCYWMKMMAADNTFDWVGCNRQVEHFGKAGIMVSKREDTFNA
jgi:hypothetical protein